MLWDLRLKSLKSAVSCQCDRAWGVTGDAWDNVYSAFLGVSVIVNKDGCGAACPLCRCVLWAPITGCTPGITRRQVPAREKGGLGPLLGLWSHSDGTDVCVCLGFWLRKPSIQMDCRGLHWHTLHDRWTDGGPGVLRVSGPLWEGLPRRDTGPWAEMWGASETGKGLCWESTSSHLDPNPGPPCRTYTLVS